MRSGDGLRAARDAQLILAMLLLAILPVLIARHPPSAHAVKVDFWPWPDRVGYLPEWAPSRIRAASIPSTSKKLRSTIFPSHPPLNPPSLRIDLSSEGEILFRGRPVDPIHLRMELDWVRARNEVSAVETALEIKPHPDAPYGKYVEILATIGKAGQFDLLIDNGVFRNVID